jgi:hypothetical protein
MLEKPVEFPEMRKFAVGPIKMYRRFVSPIVQVLAKLFGVHVAGYTEARRFEGRIVGSMADNPLQPLVQGRDRPGKMRRIV